LRHLLAVCLAVAAASFSAAAQSPQAGYGVSVTADKGTDFSKLKTYVWQSGWDANDKKIHGLIVSAIDKEMKALGFTLKASGPADVTVKYGALRRIDVQVSTKPAELELPRNQIDVGTLVVVMLSPETGKELFRARYVRPIEVTPDKIESEINSAVAEVFAKYPTRVKKQS
jgi:Domain of unknown function (DUF4136)